MNALPPQHVHGTLIHSPYPRAVETLAALRFPLEHARMRGLERVVFGSPYISIVEQSAPIACSFMIASRLRHLARRSFRTTSRRRPEGPCRPELTLASWGGSDAKVDRQQHAATARAVTHPLLK